MKNFFELLQGFDEFQKIADDSVYVEAPSTWYVVLTDVRGSTDAIQNGRYRDVNTLGAASIAMVQAELKGSQIPFVFGGDGATFLVPPENIENVKFALQKLMTLSVSQFGLELRIGIIKIDDVHQIGQKILVGKFRINKLSSIAVIKGGGLNWAEKKIKSQPDIFCLQPLSESTVVPRELSCRWQPIKSKKGTILALLIQSRDNNLATVAQITSELEAICGGDFENSNPVQIPSLRYKGFLGSIRDEFKLHDKKFSKGFFKRGFEIFLCWWAFKLGLPAPFRAREYKNELSSHSDYRKYDDVLRMILDCSKKQTGEIREALNKSYENGQIYFGLHESSHALMTCLVESVQPGGHIHFIDGSDGGYAIAAKQLKSQIQN